MKRSRYTRSERREALTGLAYAAFPLLGFTVFFAAPFAVSIFNTFRSGVGGRTFVGFANYKSLFYSESFRMALFNTVKFICIGVPTIMLIAFAVSLALNGKLRGKRFFRTVFVMPLVVPVSSVILVFQIIFERSGILNSLTAAIGLEPANYLQSSKAFSVLVMLYVWKNCGYNIILFLAGLSQIPSEYYDAAKVDGAGALRTLISVTAPLMASTFFFTFIISIINSFKVFREAYALGGQYPHESVYMLQHFMNNNFYNLNYARLSVASMLTFVFIVAMVFVLFKFKQRAGDYQL